jgi:hypothetical protein
MSVCDRVVYKEIRVRTVVQKISTTAVSRTPIPRPCRGYLVSILIEIMYVLP